MPCSRILKQPLNVDHGSDRSSMETVIVVLFNAFETLCFPQCITDTSRAYFSSVNVTKSSHANISVLGEA